MTVKSKSLFDEINEGIRAANAMILANAKKAEAYRKTIKDEFGIVTTFFSHRDYLVYLDQREFHNV